MRLKVTHLNTLITMYSRFGHIGRARNVFDKMYKRNYASWNNMISEFVEASGFSVASLVLVQSQ